MKLEPSSTVRILIGDRYGYYTALDGDAPTTPDSITIGPLIFKPDNRTRAERRKDRSKRLAAYRRASTPKGIRP